MALVEALEFPGEARQNFLVIKGLISANHMGINHSFPIKIVIPQGFPFHPPRVFLDKNIPVSLLSSKTYLGKMNSFTIPYLNNWTNQYNQRQKPTLNDMLGYLQAVI